MTRRGLESWELMGGNYAASGLHAAGMRAVQLSHLQRRAGPRSRWRGEPGAGPRAPRRRLHVEGGNLAAGEVSTAAGRARQRPRSRLGTGARRPLRGTRSSPLPELPTLPTQRSQPPPGPAAGSAQANWARPAPRTRAAAVPPRLREASALPSPRGVSGRADVPRRPPPAATSQPGPRAEERAPSRARRSRPAAPCSLEGLRLPGRSWSRSVRPASSPVR